METEAMEMIPTQGMCQAGAEGVNSSYDGVT